VSDANLDVFRRMVEAFDRRDRAGWLACRHPRTDILPSRTFPEVDVVSGPEACWDWYVSVTETFEQEPIADILDIEDLGRNQVLTHYDYEVRGRTSGAVVELDYWVLTTFRDGKVLRDEWFLTEEEARAAAGED
jgi:ketosteroid isomerase-like protein